VKSGPAPEWAQLANLIIAAAILGCDLVYVFGERPAPATLNKMQGALANAPVNAKTGKPQSIVYRYYATDARAVSAGRGGVPKGAYAPAPAAASTGAPGASPGGAPAATKGPAPVSGPGGGANVLGANGQTGQGALAAAVADSPATADAASARLEALAAETAADARELGIQAPAVTAADLGGIDFSTLELRYLSDHGGGVRYAFRADDLAADQVSFGGQRAARLASDSFFVFLQLPATAQTVNLNPTQPDQIIDDRFGRTDAGRVLLEADLQMKKSIATYINPQTPQGLRFWKALQGDTRCLAMRQWIVPGVASVRDTGDELYIIDAPLDVKMEKDYSKAADTVSATGCDSPNPTRQTHNETVYRDMILPLIKKEVNEGPAYADLRRVYASRVAAEWYKQRSARTHTTYGNLIGRNDVSQWPSQTPWDPKEVFKRYTDSYTKGEFNVTLEERQGSRTVLHTYIYGGVDLRKMPLANVAAAAFAKDHGALPGAARKSANLVQAAEGGLWLGGTTRATGPTTIPPGPTGRPLFYVTVALPVLIWLAAGAWLIRRRRGTKGA
jgi:hypothetical protein